MKKLLLLITFFASCSGAIAQTTAQLDSIVLGSSMSDTALFRFYMANRPGKNNGHEFKTTLRAMAAFFGSGGGGSGTVTSITAGNFMTGGTITTSGTIGADTSKVHSIAYLKGQFYPLTGNPSSFLTANQSITLTGNVTGSGTTSIATTIGSGVVTNAMLAGSIANSKLSNSTISGVSLGSNLFTLFNGYGLSGSSYNGSGNSQFQVDTSSSNGIVSKYNLSQQTVSGVKLGNNLATLTNGYGILGSAYNGSANQVFLVDTSATATNPATQNYVLRHSGTSAPLNQIVRGTGTGITSSSTYTYDPPNYKFNVGFPDMLSPILTSDTASFLNFDLPADLSKSLIRLGDYSNVYGGVTTGTVGHYIAFDPINYADSIVSNGTIVFQCPNNNVLCNGGLVVSTLNTGGTLIGGWNGHTAASYITGNGLKISGDSLIATGGSGWSLTGNAGTSTPGNFIGTTDNNGFSIAINDTVVSHYDSLRRQIIPQTMWGSLNFGSVIGLNVINDYSIIGGANIFLKGRQNGVSQDSLQLSQTGILFNTSHGSDFSFASNHGLHLDAYSGSSQILMADSAVTIVAPKNLNMVLNGATAGNVLTSDASGNATWQPISEWKDTVITLTPTIIDGLNVAIPLLSGAGIVLDISRCYYTAICDGSAYDFSSLIIIDAGTGKGWTNAATIMIGGVTANILEYVSPTINPPVNTSGAGGLTIATDAPSILGDGTFNINVHLTFKRETDF